MTYTEAVEFLYQLRLFGLKLGLDNTLRLAELAGRPQDRLRFVHVAGTNGKGSTCAMLESIYRAAGLRVGLFTSPHLVSFTERIQINRECISQETVSQLVEDLRGVDEISPTFFEAVTVMALKYFDAQRCDLVIWETGLGGRLDATNIVTPLASVITNVQLDHQQWLGQTIPEIAREKAGIIKPNVPVITGSEDTDALEIIRNIAHERHAPLTILSRADADAMGRYEIALAGEHQKMNAAVAAQTVRVLDSIIPVPDDAIRRGLKETHWDGRWQKLLRPNGQTIVLDGAHNPAGAETLAAAWRREFNGKHGALILGSMRDKDCAAICRTLAPIASKIFLTPVGSERSADPAALAEFCRTASPKASITICKSLADAFAQAANEPAVVVAGSLYLVGQAMEELGLAPRAQESALNEYVGKPKIRAVTFDMGGTLMEPWPSVGHVYAKVAAAHGVQASPEILNQRFAAAWKAKTNFRHEKSDWAALVDATFSGLCRTPPSQSFFPELFDAFADASAWKVFDDVIPCLERLRRDGIKLGVISNWDDRLRPLLKKLGLDKYFDSIVISCEAAEPKPARKIFRTAARQLGVTPHEILHIGDSPAEDIKGARAAGFQALLLTRGAAAEAGRTIGTLAELDVHAQAK